MPDTIVIHFDNETGDYVAAYGEHEGRGELVSEALLDLGLTLSEEGQ